MTNQYNTPLEIAKAGQQIYQEFREEYEAKYPGQFVAIELTHKKAFVASQPEIALKDGRREFPTGIFHLIKIGSAGAFRVSYTSNADSNWLF
jgi:hypothetical protein